MIVVIRLRSSRSTGWVGSVKAKPAIPHMSGGPRDRAGAAVDPAPHPELETEHGPEPGRAVPAPGIVGEQKPLDPRRPEDSALARPRIEQQIVGHVAKLAAEPRAERHAEAHLPPCEDLRAEPAGHDKLEDVLAPA